MGESVERIAELRNLSMSTIESHLAFYVQQGTLSIDEVMDKAKIRNIQSAIEQTDGKALSPIKELLGDGYSYGEIRMVVAYVGRE